VQHREKQEHVGSRDAEEEMRMKQPVMVWASYSKPVVSVFCYRPEDRQSASLSLTAKETRELAAELLLAAKECEERKSDETD
jgi:hypothetical protein